MPKGTYERINFFTIPSLLQFCVHFPGQQGKVSHSIQETQSPFWQHDDDDDGDDDDDDDRR